MREEVTSGNLPAESGTWQNLDRWARGKSAPDKRACEVLQGKPSETVLGSRSSPPGAGRVRPVMVSPSRRPAQLLLHPRQLEVAGAVPGRGRTAGGKGFRRLVAPEVMSRGRGQGFGHAPCPCPKHQPPCPECRFLGGGAQAASLPLQVTGGAGALSVGGELGAETGDPPERAQPSPGLDAYKRRLVLPWDACAFSNIPTATL